MKRFILEQSNTEYYTSHSGLVLIEQNQPKNKEKTWYSHYRLRSFLGLLCLGKSDYDALENHRADAFFKQMPSASRLRQRFDEDASHLMPLIDEANIEFLQRIKAPITANKEGYVVLDADLFPMDNSKTKKEGVSRTYKQFDGYGSMASYIGEEGWNLGCELREGSWHCQKEFNYTLERIMERAKKLTSQPLLMRLDSGNDALDNRFQIKEAGVDFIIKWNPRRQNLSQWVNVVDDQAQWKTHREGKRVAVFSEYIEESLKDKTEAYRRVIRVIERTIDKHGQRLLIPDIVTDSG